MPRRVFACLLLIATAGAGSAFATNWAVFIKFDGLTADSEAGIEAASFSVGHHAIDSCVRAASATGKVDLQRVTFTHRIDKASPKLTESAAAGTSFEKVKVTIRQPGGEACALVFEQAGPLRLERRDSLEEVSFGFKRVSFESLR